MTLDIHYLEMEAILSLCADFGIFRNALCRGILGLQPLSESIRTRVRAALKSVEVEATTRRRAATLSFILSKTERRELEKRVPKNGTLAQLIREEFGFSAIEKEAQPAAAACRGRQRKRALIDSEISEYSFRASDEFAGMQIDKSNNSNP